MQPPASPKIYHILHVDRLRSVIAEGSLWSDLHIRFIQVQPGRKKRRLGTSIGIERIKQRRLSNPIKCRPGLNVGDCIPFYFCPRSVMLYVIHIRGDGLAYRGGQDPIVHLEADLKKTVAWAEKNKVQWAFTLGNAGSREFEDRCDLHDLDDLNWNAIKGKLWDYRKTKEAKQAKFLVEQSFPWALVQRIGVCTSETRDRVNKIPSAAAHRPALVHKPEWYY